MHLYTYREKNRKNWLSVNLFSSGTVDWFSIQCIRVFECESFLLARHLPYREKWLLHTDCGIWDHPRSELQRNYISHP